MEKYVQYAALISQQVSEMFSDDSENHIDRNELMEEANFKAFFLALSTCVPCSFWNQLQNIEPVDTLEFNHIANRLVFENANVISS